MEGGEVNLQYLLGFPNGEHWIVVPGVVGSNPISHPLNPRFGGGFLCVKVALGVGATEDSTLFHPMSGWLEKLFVHI